MERTNNVGDVVPFGEAIKTQKLGSHTYSVTLVDSFCIGTVPNGGYVASCLLEAARLHLAPTGQKDVLNAHFQFLNRTETGSAVIIIEDVKLGRQLSTLHATLYQRALLPEAPWITHGSTRKEIVAYLTMADLSKETGISLPIPAFGLQYPLAPPPTPDFAALKEDRDPNWTQLKFPPGSPLGYARCLQNCVYYAPKRGQPIRSIIDKWVRLASGEKFTASSLGYVSDCWPYVVEAHRPSKREAEERRRGGDPVPFAPGARFWYPTVVLNLELKKPLPEAGLEWLQLRIQSKQVKNGRLDLEILVLDEMGELVALSNHVNLILGSERNTAERSKTNETAHKDSQSRF
ncbi:Thioesterase domain-containing protein [Madurella fahalii]|uniref:Thioesterase domain-containing protein n=1 Tax=Madurella fahalii TaxID=1157608 RepID=A0ABQ0G7M8_9PEZI